MSVTKIAFGGGCHWCTEAVFQHLKGVEKVAQSWVASIDENKLFSEAVIVHFSPQEISINTLIEVHLYTHKSTSEHTMRKKYRSAIYTFNKEQYQSALAILLEFKFASKIITKVLPFKSFKASREAIQNYYKKDPQKPFCETFINPKLKLLLKQFSKFTKVEELKHLETEKKSKFLNQALL